MDVKTSEGKTVVEFAERLKRSDLAAVVSNFFKSNSKVLYL